MAVRKIKNSWWVDFRADYKRYRKRSPENTKAGAEAYEALLRSKLVRGEQIEKTANVSQQERLFEQFAWLWFEQYVQCNNKFSEQRHKKYILSASLVPFFGKIPLKEISAYHIEQYKARTMKEGVANKTINNRLTVLRKCLSTAYDWLEFEGAPPKITWLKCPPSTFDHLSPEECALLSSHADGVVYEMILTALRTGMRQGELKGLQWSSIDWQNRTVTVRHSRNDYTKQLESPKSNRERYIPLDIDVCELLHKRKKDTGYVFMDVDKQPFNNKRLNRRLKKICKSAGLRKIGWHTLRHTFASHLAMRGVPITAVQALLGHSTINTTMRYAHTAPSTLRTAIDMLNPKTMISASFGQPVGNQWNEALQQETNKP
ncbi:MAG: tyrosine-type recombinase/integrase [bacterium]